MPIQVRVGVNTGRVAVGTATDRTIVIGAEVNIGARLQQAAEPGEVLVGAATRQLVGNGVRFGQVRSVEAKGLDGAMAAWPALDLAGPPTRRSLHMVNRRRELALLSDTFERMKARERAHLVTLLGEPGIGKTRVVEEFLGGLDEDVKVLAGRSSPFEEEVTFWPLAQMVYREIDAERDAPDAEITERLHALVAEWVEPADAEDVVRRLALALGVEEDGSSEEGQYQAAEVRAGLLALLTGLASRGPVVLVFEDLHEADPLLLDLIEQLVKEARKVPLMVLCVARWEFLEDRPNWAGGIADAVTLWVEALTPGHAAELAMEAGDLAYEEAERVALHAGGNPYFVVEMVGMMRREERDLPPRGPAASARLLPPTVQAVIAARIDQLSPAARAMVQRASVFPRGRFDLDELSLIVEPRKELLAEAEAEELLAARRRSPRPVAVRFGHPARRRLRHPREARAAAAPPACRQQARRRGDGRALPPHDRVPPRAGGSRLARPQPTGARHRRARGGGARMGGRHRPPPDRVAFRGRPVRACPGAWRARTRHGANAKPASWARSARPGTGWGSSISPRPPCIGPWRWRARPATGSVRTPRASSPISR